MTITYENMFKCSWDIAHRISPMLRRSVVSDSLRPHGLSTARPLCPWDFPGNNIGVGCHFLLQARILEWVTFPFCRGSSQPWDRSQVSCTADRFFTSWATREAPRLQCISGNGLLLMKSFFSKMEEDLSKEIKKIHWEIHYLSWLLSTPSEVGTIQHCTNGRRERLA